MLIKIEQSALLVIDIQERLAPAMQGIDDVIKNTKTLLRAATLLEAPVLVSEQYPKGLGITVPDLRPMISEGTIEKISFSCMGEADFAERFTSLGRGQAVVAGIESHVCVLQTVMDLLASGIQVFVVSDATSSRTTANCELALRRMQAAGAEIVSTEMVVFEWLGQAATAEFKELLPLVK